MRRLEATITCTDDEINRLARRGKQRGHIPGVGRVLLARGTASPSTPASESTLNSLNKKVEFMMSLFKSESKYSDMFSQFESGGASGSGGCGDDEESADDQEDEDEDGDGDKVMKGLSECKASKSNIRRIRLKEIVKEVKDYLKTYSSVGMDISRRETRYLLKARQKVI
ncbi:hypothetical protein Tco_0730019 [Tanacetum coccineum]|uniref:Uncharacterized protein n=1 Tax=Tanacetum coccineum TaxID=301880 RepID=A0ABQ4YU42_9ASTR